MTWLDLLAATPTPTAPPVDANDVTPGVAGFVAIFLVAAATVLLLVDMTRRIRRTRYRSEINEQLDAEELEARNPAAGAGAPISGTDTGEGPEASTADRPRD